MADSLTAEFEGGFMWGYAAIHFADASGIPFTSTEVKGLIERRP
jgi:hypothetical protein